MRLRDALQRAVANRPLADYLRADVLRKLRGLSLPIVRPGSRKTLGSWNSHLSQLFFLAYSQRNGSTCAVESS